ncbi:MAG: carbohydrate-binding family 9-like protein [Ginsengibacter sp.]
MKNTRFTKILFLLFSILFSNSYLYAQYGASNKVIVKHTDNFTVTGDGTAPNWEATTWNTITQRDRKTLEGEGWNMGPERNVPDRSYKTLFKILYSDKGIYCLYQCEDSVITATITEDYGALYNEDVVEAFFRPDTSLPLYLEYELSPLNYELPILIINKGGNSAGWKPWGTHKSSSIIHAVKVNDKKAGNSRFNWTAEFFIPFTLLMPLGNVPPSPGTKWRANFYRIDYDGNPVYSSWQLTRKNYHDYERFGLLEFE